MTSGVREVKGDRHRAMLEIDLMHKAIAAGKHKLAKHHQNLANIAIDNMLGDTVS